MSGPPLHWYSHLLRCQASFTTADLRNRFNHALMHCFTTTFICFSIRMTRRGENNLHLVLPVYLRGHVLHTPSKYHSCHRPQIRWKPVFTQCLTVMHRYYNSSTVWMITLRAEFTKKSSGFPMQTAASCSLRTQRLHLEHSNQVIVIHFGANVPPFHAN